MTVDYSREAAHYTAVAAQAELEELLKVAYRYCYTPWELKGLRPTAPWAALRSAVDKASAAVDNAKRAQLTAEARAAHPSQWTDDMYDYDPVADYHARMQELRAEKVRYDTTIADWIGDEA